MADYRRINGGLVKINSWSWSSIEREAKRWLSEGEDPRKVLKILQEKVDFNDLHKLPDLIKRLSGR